MYKSKKWFKSLISKRTQLVRKNGEKTWSWIKRRKNPHKKSSKCIKMSEEKITTLSFKVFWAWEPMSSSFPSRCIRGGPGCTLGEPGCTQGGPGCTSASSSAFPFAPRRIICKTRNSANSYIQCKCNCRSSSLKSPTPQNSTQTSVESALLCVI